MTEKPVPSGDLELWTEAFGDPSDPVLLLIIGADSQCLGWPDSMCEGLAAGGRYVIRYDHRNSGKSSLVDFEKEPYDCADLARDAVAVLDAYGVGRAHVAGASMGGFIGQLLALDHRERVRSLTLISTSSALGGVIRGLSGEDTYFSPPPHADYLAEVHRLQTRLAQSPPSTREEAIEARVQSYLLLRGSLHYDEDACRRTLTREYDRARVPGHTDTSPLAVGASFPIGDLGPRLRDLDVPTLVLHGTDDPIVPVEHGRALADCIPGADYIELEGYGHAAPDDAVIETWSAVILRHTRHA
ncbi:alpha/beta fold hydrolase [Streptomyces sp. NPDC012935]|uniref:alpha/beta fold hydrolase n=1 Tax=Streptomyces sp. NPDC012935 TaxID=3364857 RepID=UPI00369D468D